MQLNEINCWFSKMDVVFSTSFSSFIHCKLLEKTYVTKMSVNQWEQHPVWIKTMWEKNYEYWLWTIYFLLFKQKKSAIRLLFYVRAHENRNAVIQMIFSIPFPKWIFSITRSTGSSFATVATRLAHNWWHKPNMVEFFLVCATDLWKKIEHPPSRNPFNIKPFLYSHFNFYAPCNFFCIFFPNPILLCENKQMWQKIDSNSPTKKNAINFPNDAEGEEKRRT